jgi:hypothetical protein
MKLAAAACAVLAVGLLAAPAQARPLRGGARIEQVAEVLRHAGLPATLGVDAQGDPSIKSELNGESFDVFCYTNDKGLCVAIQFSTAYDLPDGTTYERVNQWNREHRYAQASVDAEMDPFLDMAVEVERGASSELIEEILKDWLELFGAWQDYFDET